MRRIFMGVAMLVAASVGTAVAGSHQLSGTLSHSGVEDGVPAYFKLVGAGEACTDRGPGRYAGQASFGQGQAAYTVEGVAAGAYTACFFIDTDDNIAATGAPTSGDYGAIN